MGHDHPATGLREFRFCPRCGSSLKPRRLKEAEPERLVCDRCSFVFYLDPKVAAGTLFTLDGGLVLLRRGIEPGYGKWVFPGGFVDRGEPVHEAAVRETREEAGLDVRLDRVLGVYSFPAQDTVVVAYAAEIVGGHLEARDESLEARAFPRRAIPWDELAFPSTRAAVRDYLGIGPGKGA
jgi:ADP-ribose pyrophosphatase YjhB (NUDIX family)